jgi:amino acid transporter
MPERTGRRMSTATVAMLIVVTTFGIGNVIDNEVELGLSAIPSWFAVGFLYFLPLALILAEFASDTREARGGIYSYMERGLGPTWAFVGTWSYFVSNVVYLQTVFSRLPIRISLALTGKDAFQDAAWILPLLGVGICIVLTFVASRGVRFFSHLANWVGRGTILLAGLLIVVPIAVVIRGGASATAYSLPALRPALDLRYFSTFAWLLFAVSGAEVAGPYVKETRDPQRSFPRAILFSTILIGLLYVLATVAVGFALPVGELTKATGLYDIFVRVGALMHLPAVPFGKATQMFLAIGSVAAYVIWMESPLRAMFAEIPRGTFPAFLTRRDAGGTHQQALWAQAVVVIVLTLIPLISILTGTSGSEAFIRLLNDLTSLSLIIPYIFVALAYIRARADGMTAPFRMARSTPLAIGIGVVVVVVSALGYLGAGLFALEADSIDWIYVGVVYAGPVAMILLGLLLRRWSSRADRTAAAEAGPERP